MKNKSAPYGRAGSKVRLAHWIAWIASFIMHKNWGELFAGSCAVTLNKRREKWEFLNDKDIWIHNFLFVLRDRKLKAELLRRLRYTCWEKADFERCTAIIKGKLPAPNDPVELARIFLVNNCQSFDHHGNSFSISDVKSGVGKWRRINQYIDAMAERIRDCNILNHDYAEALKLSQINDPKTLIYVDGPYVGPEKTFYAVNKEHGFDHLQLREAIEACEASFLVSYEDHPLIRDLYSETDGWIVKQAEVRRCLANSGKRVSELLIIRKSAWAMKQPGKMPLTSGIQDLFGLDGEPLDVGRVDSV